MAEHRLYGDSVTIGFDGRKHIYTWKEKNAPVPGVTSILKRLSKEMLVGWAAKMSAEYVLAKMIENLRGTVHASVMDDLLAVAHANGAYLGFLPEEMKSIKLPSLTLGELEKTCVAAKGHHQRFTREAATIGKQVHAYAEAYLRWTMPGGKKTRPSLPDTKDERIHRGCAAFDQWVQAHRVEVIEPEKVIFSRQHFYAGTADFVGYIDDEYVVGDFKTSSGIYVDHLLQTAAYQLALEEELGDRVPARWLIRLDKRSGEFHAERYPRSTLHSEAFLALRDLHRLMTKIEETR